MFDRVLEDGVYLLPLILVADVTQLLLAVLTPERFTSLQFVR